MRSPEDFERDDGIDDAGSSSDVTARMELLGEALRLMQIYPATKDVFRFLVLMSFLSTSASSTSEHPATAFELVARLFNTTMIHPIYQTHFKHNVEYNALESSTSGYPNRPEPGTKAMVLSSLVALVFRPREKRGYKCASTDTEQIPYPQFPPTALPGPCILRLFSAGEIRPNVQPQLGFTIKTTLSQQTRTFSSFRSQSTLPLANSPSRFNISSTHILNTTLSSRVIRLVHNLGPRYTETLRTGLEMYFTYEAAMAPNVHLFASAGTTNLGSGLATGLEIGLGEALVCAPAVCIDRTTTSRG
ncbi:unnamed protein product [Rhizoctonia solani]|uniref:Uncharacterized protein n=1 Tax=Rhizoctonia solani TaxID=456999 RepID=A0A8H3H9V5_9AGAM|nr:unnamed protein product [Rhizoctonia solani]